MRKRTNKDLLLKLIQEGYRSVDIIENLSMSKTTFYRLKQEFIKQGLL